MTSDSDRSSARPRKRRTLLLGGLVVFALTGFGAYRLHQWGRSRALPSVCENDLMQLAAWHRHYVEAHGFEDIRGGVPYLFRLVDANSRTPELSAIHLWCPLDEREQPTVAEVAARKRPLHELTSYVARDFVSFPLDRAAAADEPLFAFVSDDHPKVLIAYCEGPLRRLTRSDLGLGPDDPLVIGPESKSPLLRKLCIEPAEPSSPR